MKGLRRLRHPLWTHAGGFTLWALMLGFLFAAPLPEKVPMHFGLDGRPDRWGSPLEFILLVAILPLFFLALGVLADELWSREESERKRFNYFAPADELVIGLFAGFVIGYMRDPARAAEKGLYSDPALVAALAGGAVAAAVLLEMLRPFSPAEPEEERHLSVGETARRIASAGKPAFWQAQDPAWLRTVVPVTVAVLLFGALITALTGTELHILVALPVMLAGAALSAALWGGIRIFLTGEALEVRLGHIGARLLKLPLDEIAEVSVTAFSPLRDFGGWGIRYGRKGTWGYFLGGGKGVLVVSKKGKRYLLGSDDPERLEAALKAMLERRRKTGGEDKTRKG